MNASVPDRNLALELVRVTEAAALAAARWSGAGDKIAADQAAVDAMRTMFDTVSMDGVVVIGEGEKDEAPMLYNGEHVGDGSGPLVDVAVDPLEGTTLVARGMPNALAVVAIAEKGAMFDPGPCVYMEKMAGGADIADLISLEDPMEDVLRRIADKRGVAVGDLMIVILDRPRHNEMVERIRRAGARIRFISDGDVAGALLAVREGTGVDLLWGIGGTPEGVLSATAIKCLGGTIVGRLWPRDEGEASRARAAGYDLGRVLHLEDLVAGENCFFAATGVTDGSLLEGVRYERSGASTHSMVMRASSGTVRLVHARHDRAKLRAIAGERYG
jgi:fructose-1,6-bisphosphatase II